MNGHNENGAKSATPCLEFNHVWFQYQAEPVVEDVTFSINKGEFVAILGPNGSGKTTLAKLALGLLKATSGTVKLFGESPNKFRAWQRVGFVPQTVEGVDAQFPATVEEIVSQGLYSGFDPLAFWRRSGSPATLRAMEAVSISELKDRRISSLSVGQQQRTLIARALVREPELLVLDEPEGGVDAAGQEQLYTMLHRFNVEGMTILMVSHDIGAVLRQATTVACINRSLVFHGPPHKITQKELSALYGLPMDVLLHDVLHEHR